MRFLTGLSLGVLGVVLGGLGPVAAADLPSRALAPVPPIVVPAFTWTGFYVGVQAGWAQTQNKLTAGAATSGAGSTIALPTLTKDGFAGGLLAGYNYQIGSVVVGAEVDGEFLVTGKGRYTAETGDFITAHTNWVGSARGRVGYAFDRVLIYATGGLALAAPKSTVTGTEYSYGAGDSTRVGGPWAQEQSLRSPTTGLRALNTATHNTKAARTATRLASAASGSSASRSS